MDPNNVTPVQLELGGREKGQSATFQGLALRRFGGIRASRFAAEAPVAQVLDLPFGDAVTLHGYTVLNNGDLLLFWQRPTPAAETAGRPAPGAANAHARRPAAGAAAGSAAGGLHLPVIPLAAGPDRHGPHPGSGLARRGEPPSGRSQVTLRVYDAATPPPPR